MLAIIIGRIVPVSLYFLPFYLYIPYSLGSLWQRMVLYFCCYWRVSFCIMQNGIDWCGDYFVKLYFYLICIQITFTISRELLIEEWRWKSMRRNVNPLSSLPNFAQWTIVLYLLVCLLYMIAICDATKMPTLKKSNFEAMVHLF